LKGSSNISSIKVDDAIEDMEEVRVEFLGGSWLTFVGYLAGKDFGFTR
jgi:hypothetical protein